MEPMQKKNPLALIATMPQKPAKWGYERQIKVSSNHYGIKLNIQRSKIYVYRLKISPEVSQDNRQLKRQIFQKIEDEIKQCLGNYYITGWVLFGQKCSDKVNIFQTKVGNQSYDIDIGLVKNKKTFEPRSIALEENKECIQFLNSIMKKMMIQIGYKDIGILSKYFNVDPQQVQNADLQVYRGFYTAIDVYQNNTLKLLLDVSTRLLQSVSCLQFMNTLKNQQEVEDSIIGNSVIVQYGNYKTYYIDDIMYKMTINDSFECKGQKITYKQYYEKQYGLKIKDNKQPLLLSIRKQKDAQGNSQEMKVYLIPELVKLTGMTNKERSNFKIMQEVAKFTKLFPNQRMEQQNTLLQTLQQKMKEDVNCPISIEQNLEINALAYANPQIQLRSKSTPIGGDFKKDMKNPIYKPVDIPLYQLVYHADQYEDAENLATTFKQCASAYAIKIGNVEYSEMNDTTPKNWGQYLEEDFKKYGGKNKVKIVVILLPNYNTDNVYNAIKDVCCNNLQVLSQCVKPRTLQKNTKSVVSNLLLQMVAKLNGTLWTVERPIGLKNNVMLIGVDVHHGGVGRKKFSVVGMAATMDNNFSRYYCRTMVQEKRDQEIIHKGVAALIVDNVKVYFEENKQLPETIVIYRDGVGDSMFDQVRNIEIPQINQGIEQLQKMVGSQYCPKLALFIVAKRIKDRFFVGNSMQEQQIRQQGRGGRGGQQKQADDVTNCESGTIVFENVVQDQGFEFFMVSQNVNQGTCTPTRYVQLANNTDINQEQFFKLTYFQCFNYYNWPGAVKVPAVVQYANNVAMFVGQVFIQNPKEKEPIHLARQMHLYHL